MLLSEELYQTAKDPMPSPAHAVSQEFKGIGRTRAYFMMLRHVWCAGSMPKPSVVGRVGKTLSVAGTGTPYMVGLRRPRAAATPV